jgi:hypothetical protein
VFRAHIVGLCCLLAATGCSNIRKATGDNIDRAHDLGLIAETPPPKLPPLITDLPVSYSEIDRNAFAEQWMARSDYLCRMFKDNLIAISRDQRLSTDIASTVLSGLATIFTPLSVVHPLTGAATIVTGVGAAASTDTFGQQTGDVLASAIQTARENQANQIEQNLTLPVARYDVYRAQRDVVDYHGMCSLETALQQIRASLKASAPDAGTSSPARQGGQVQGEAAPAAILPSGAGGRTGGRVGAAASGGAGGSSLPATTRAFVPGQ